MKNVLRLIYVSLLLLFTLNCDDDDPIQFQLTTEASPKEGGNVSPASAAYNEGTEVEITATANEEYLFKNWTGDASGNENPMKVMMTDDMVVTAVFEKVQYALEIIIFGGGSVNQNVLQDKGTTDYDSGTLVELTAVPHDEWIFVGWSGDLEGMDNPVTVEMKQAMRVSARFVHQGSEKIYVPDDNFENALIELGYDDLLDDYVYKNAIAFIKELDLSNRQIQDLTGIEGFTELNVLDVSNNNLTSLDVSNIPFIQALYCNGNQLTYLDISGNLALEPSLFRATDNPLGCIQISALQIKWGSWLGPGAFAAALAVDDGATYSIDCSVSPEDKTYIPDDQFEQALIDLGLDDVLDDYVKTIDIMHVTDLDISGRNISDLTGMKDFKALLILNASNNDLSGNLDVSEWTFFFNLDFRDNPLTCVQVPDYWLESYGGGLSFIWVDDGVEFSLDCGD